MITVKNMSYLDYQMTTYDFDGYAEEVMFKLYNELYTPSVEVCGEKLIIGGN